MEEDVLSCLIEMMGSRRLWRGGVARRTRNNFFGGSKCQRHIFNSQSASVSERIGQCGGRRSPRQLTNPIIHTSISSRLRLPALHECQYWSRCLFDASSTFSGNSHILPIDSYAQGELKGTVQLYSFSLPSIPFKYFMFFNLSSLLEEEGECLSATNSLGTIFLAPKIPAETDVNDAPIPNITFNASNDYS